MRLLVQADAYDGAAREGLRDSLWRLHSLQRCLHDHRFGSKVPLVSPAVGNLIFTNQLQVTDDVKGSRWLPEFSAGRIVAVDSAGDFQAEFLLTNCGDDSISDLHWVLSASFGAYSMISMP